MSLPGFELPMMLVTNTTEPCPGFRPHLVSQSWELQHVVLHQVVAMD